MMAVPWIMPVVRRILLDDPVFNAACGGRCSPRAPSNVTSPFVTVQTIGGNAIYGPRDAYSPLVQVDGWAPVDAQKPYDPEHYAWEMASLAADILARVRNYFWPPSSWLSTYVAEGPISDVDTSRGASVPLYRALIRAQVKIITECSVDEDRRNPVAAGKVA